MSDSKEQVSGQENVGDVQSCCDGGDCCPSGSASGGKSWKTLIFVLVLIAAGVVLAHSFIGESDADQSQQTFAPIQIDNMSDIPSPSKAAVNAETPVVPKIETETQLATDETEKQDMPAEVASSLWGLELDSLASLNKVATETDAVFVFLAAGSLQNMQPVIKQIEAAAQKIESNGVRVTAFRLKEAAPEYAQLSKQVSIPCVLAMVKGGGMSTVSGEISEAKLVQAFVAASRPTSGCCPPGTDASDCP